MHYLKIMLVVIGLLSCGLLIAHEHVEDVHTYKGDYAWNDSLKADITVFTPEDIYTWVDRLYNTNNASEFPKWLGKRFSVTGVFDAPHNTVKPGQAWIGRWRSHTGVNFARSLGIMAEFKDGTTFEQGTWLEVMGHLEMRPTKYYPMPVIVVEQFRPGKPGVKFIAATREMWEEFKNRKPAEHDHHQETQW